MTTPQHPYGPQGRPAQPYRPTARSGPYGGPSPSGPYGGPPPGAPSWGPPSQGRRPPAGYPQQGPGAQPMRAENVVTARPGADHARPGFGGGGPGTRSAEYDVPRRPSGSGRPPQRTEPPRNGLGTTALVLGILAAVFAMIPIIGLIAWPLSVLGLIFGLVGIARTRSGTADNTGVAISGTVLSAVGLILCILWVAAFGSAVSETSPTVTGGTGATSGAFPGATSDDVVAGAGEPLTVGDVQVSATALTSGDATIGQTLCTTVTYTNNGSSPSTFNGGFDWKLQDPAGAALMTGLLGSDNLLSAGQLAPGGTTTGDVCFDRPTATSGQYVLLYQPTLSFSSSRGAWLNQVG